MKSLRRFVIVGCGRSGTTYMAHLLRQLGCECEHEAYFPSLQKMGLAYLSPLHRFRVRFFRVGWPMPPWGEIAWQAAPFLQALPAGTVVFHQVRHPIHYMRSRQKKGLTFFPFRDQYCPIPVRCHDQASFAALPLGEQGEYLAQFWMRWNKIIERSSRVRRIQYERYRLEDVDPGWVDHMLKTVGVEMPPEQIRDVWDGTEQKIHSLGPTDERITADLLASDTRSRLEGQAARYGYTLDDEPQEGAP